MLELKNRKPYWRHTKIHMLATLLPLGTIMAALPFFADGLMRQRFLGFPLGYFLCAHGFVVLLFAFMAWYVSQQDAIDHWHGAHEDL